MNIQRPYNVGNEKKFAAYKSTIENKALYNK